MIEQFRRWFEYEQEMHAKVLASLETVPQERRLSEEFRKAVSIFGHIVAARRIWLYRLGIVPIPAGSLHPENPNLDQITAEWHSVRGPWKEYLARIDDNELSRTFEYQSLDAGRFRNRIEDVLTQLFGHSWYHRGQIAMLVRAAGGQPAITDLIYWCREAVV